LLARLRLSLVDLSERRCDRGRGLRLGALAREALRTVLAEGRRGPTGIPSDPKAARLSGNVRQPNHIANEIAGHKAERRPGAGEEGLAATKHHGAEVESILINKAKVG
jgi:hypothetical protein